MNLSSGETISAKPETNGYDYDYEKGNKKKNDGTKQSTTIRSGKVITNALCTLIQVSDSVNGRLQAIQHSTAEINLLRQEIIEMNKKLDHLIELAEKSPDEKSTLMKYLLS